MFSCRGCRDLHLYIAIKGIFWEKMKKFILHEGHPAEYEQNSGQNCCEVKAGRAVQSYSFLSCGVRDYCSSSVSTYAHHPVSSPRELDGCEVRWARKETWVKTYIEYVCAARSIGPNRGGYGNGRRQGWPIRRLFWQLTIANVTGTLTVRRTPLGSGSTRRLRSICKYLAWNGRQKSERLSRR